MKPKSRVVSKLGAVPNAATISAVREADNTAALNRYSSFRALLRAVAAPRKKHG